MYTELCFKHWRKELFLTTLKLWLNSLPKIPHTHSSNLHQSMCDVSSCNTHSVILHQWGVHLSSSTVCLMTRAWWDVCRVVQKTMHSVSFTQNTLNNASVCVCVCPAQRSWAQQCVWCGLDHWRRSSSALLMCVCARVCAVTGLADSTAASHYCVSHTH